MMTAAAEGLWWIATPPRRRENSSTRRRTTLNVREPEDAIYKPGSGLGTDPSVVGVRLKSPFKDVSVMICTDSRRCIAD